MMNNTQDLRGIRLFVRIIGVLLILAGGFNFAFMVGTRSATNPLNLACTLPIYFLMFTGGGLLLAIRLEVDGKIINLVKSLTWLQWLFAASPSVVLMIDGSLGIVFAILGICVNVIIFRSKLWGVLKYLFATVVTLLVIIGYIYFVILLAALLSYS